MTETDITDRLLRYTPKGYPAHGSGYVALFTEETRFLLNEAAREIMRLRDEHDRMAALLAKRDTND